MARTAVCAELTENFVVQSNPEAPLPFRLKGQRDVPAQHVAKSVASVPALDIRRRGGHTSDQSLFQSQAVLDRKLTHFVFDQTLLEKTVLRKRSHRREIAITGCTDKGISAVSIRCGVTGSSLRAAAVAVAVPAPIRPPKLSLQVNPPVLTHRMISEIHKPI